MIIINEKWCKQDLDVLIIHVCIIEIIMNVCRQYLFAELLDNMV